MIRRSFSQSETSQQMFRSPCRAHERHGGSILAAGGHKGGGLISKNVLVGGGSIKRGNENLYRRLLCSRVSVSDREVGKKVEIRKEEVGNEGGGLRTEDGRQRPEDGNQESRKAKIERGISRPSRLPASAREKQSHSLPNQDTGSGRLSRGGVSFSWRSQSAHPFRLSCVVRVIASGGTPGSLCQIRRKAAWSLPLESRRVPQSTRVGCIHRKPLTIDFRGLF
jgi:hypothetical protein